MQCIMLLYVSAADIFGPVPFTHTGIYPVIYFAECLLLNKKRIAGKFKMIKRISNQLLLHNRGILLPFAL